MECYSQRFQSVRKTTFTHRPSVSTSGKDGLSARPLRSLHHSYFGTTEENLFTADNNRQELHRQNNVQFWHCFLHFARLLYAGLLYVYNKILAFLDYAGLIICQLFLEKRGPQLYRRRSSEGNLGESFPLRSPSSVFDKIFSSNKFNVDNWGRSPSSKWNKNKPVFSSDEEDWSDNGDDEDVAVDKAIDDYELPCVWFVDNFLYFLRLFHINYPAFEQEFSEVLRGWAFSKEYVLNYGHNLNPKKTRSRLFKKGITFLKKRELHSRMSRVRGEDEHRQWVLKIALVSRFLIFIIQLVCRCLPEFFRHNNDGLKFAPEESYGKLLDPFVNATFGGYVNWDAHYFLHISVYGYTSENFLAFFPLLPMILYFPSRITYAFFGSVISLSSIVIIASVVLNTWLFVQCTHNIYKIASLWSRGSQQFVTTACLMFSVNPASIFFNGLYTETLFAYLTSKCILTLFEGNYWTSVLYSSISAVCRSNGILNVGFILALMFQREVTRRRGNFRIANFALSCILIMAIAVIPFSLFQVYGMRKFCDESILYEPNSVPLYCINSYGWKMPYSYVQQKYWNVGFLEYFQVKQIPNFILASPVLYFLGTESWKALKISLHKHWNFNCLYFLVQACHGLFLTFFCFFFVHVQVSTRMIMSACPYLYTFIADSHLLELELFRNGRLVLPYKSLGITMWCIIYFLLGTIAFSLGLPWT